MPSLLTQFLITDYRLTQFLIIVDHQYKSSIPWSFVIKLLQQLSLSGCCCQTGGNLTNLLSTPAGSSPLLPSHLLSLADTQWCPSDWNSHDPSSLFLPCQWTECGCRRGLRSGVLSQKKWQQNAPETGRRRQQGFLAISHWDLPNSIKSPHTILTYLELLKLLEYKLSFKERTTWEGLCVPFALVVCSRITQKIMHFQKITALLECRKTIPLKKSIENLPTVLKCNPFVIVQ